MSEDRADERDNPGGSAVPPPLVYLGGLLLGFLLQGAYPAPFLPARAARPLGVALLVGGALLSLWFGRTMRRADNPIRPDRPASKLITDGPFRLSRNPGYLSFAMLQAGAACFANSFWAVLLVPVTVAVIRRRVVEKEERYLEREFGEAYLRYKACVGRWI